MKELNDLKKSYEGIEIPDELDLTIEKAIKRGRSARHVRFIRPAAIAAAVILAFVLSVNISPAFASYVEKIPGLGEIARLVKFDRGLEAAVDKGYVQKIGKSSEDKGIKFAVDSIIADKRRLIIAYTLYADKKYSGILFGKNTLTDSGGKVIPALVSYGSPDISRFKETGEAKGLLEVDLPDDKNQLPDDITIKCSSFRLTGDEGTEDTEVAGQWEVAFTVDKHLSEAKPQVYSLDREMQVGDMKFLIEYMKIYPTVIDVKIKADENNGMRFTGFKNLHIEDEKGTRYSFRVGTLPGEETMFGFESSYFIGAKKFYLVGDGVYTMPLEDKYLVLDLDNKKVIDDGGFGISYLYNREGEQWGSREYDFTAAFNVKIPENEENDDTLSIELDFKAVDENGREYNLGSRFATGGSGRGYKEFGFGIEKMDKAPHTLKIRILRTYMGIMEPFRIKLK